MSDTCRVHKVKVAEVLLSKNRSPFVSIDAELCSRRGYFVVSKMERLIGWVTHLLTVR